MEFRLARRQDLTAKTCQTILSDAEEYCKEVPQDKVSPWEILNTFINFVQGRIKDPQFWLAIKEDKLAGYMITQAITQDNEPAVFIREAYIQKSKRADGVLPYSLEVLYNKAKESGAKAIICQRYGDSKAFGRLMSKHGYEYKATEFRRVI